MKKLLLGTAAVAAGLVLASPAQAQVKLDLSGHFKGYMFYTGQDNVTGADERSLDIVRETEIHFTGETTLDNGLTIGVHHEADIDGNPNDDIYENGESFITEESYAYFSGAWGRVNFGKEDGANYLLQVAAPSADDNFDGIRQYVNPFNYGAAGLSFFDTDYANDASGNANKITYLTPVFSGFQAGLSYTPDLGDEEFRGVSQGFASNLEDQDDEYGSAWDLGLRYEGQFDMVGFAVGGGYTHVDLESDSGAGLDDFNEWNVGLDLNIGAFGIGAVYTTNNSGVDASNNDVDTWVVGVDYTTGPFKLGASYLNKDFEAADTDVDRWTGGVVYTYGPGLTFRGSISHINHDFSGGTDVDGTSVLLGTQINF